VGVPGFVKGLEHAHTHYGSGHVGLECCSFSDLVWKAIGVAMDVNASDHLVNATRTKLEEGILETLEFKHLA
jgi:gamma-glutamyltranspeptidase